MSRALSDPPEPTMGVLGIFHAVITVSEMDRALAFYRDILGLRVTFDDFHDPVAIAQLFGLDEPRVRSVIVECPDHSEVELIEFDRPRGRSRADRTMPDAGLAALNLRVSRIEELADRIRAGGFVMSSEVVEQTLPDGATLKVGVCRGPDDVTVILVEPPAGRRSLGGET